jgi:hypothetical protein
MVTTKQHLCAKLLLQNSNLKLAKALQSKSLDLLIRT